MRVYKVGHYSSETGLYKVSYHPSEATAKKAKKMDGDAKRNTLESMEVPTSKSALIDFLNIHAAKP